MKYRKALLALVLIVLPGAGVVYGSYLLYKTMKRKPRTTEEFLNSLREEIKNEKTDTQ